MQGAEAHLLFGYVYTPNPPHTHTLREREREREQRKSCPRQGHQVMTQDTWTARDRCAKSVASKILALANADAMTATCVVLCLLSSASLQLPRWQLRHCAYAHPRTQPRTQARTRSHAHVADCNDERGPLAPRHGGGHDLLDREGGGRQGYQSC